METQISHFGETMQALNEIDEALSALQNALENKQENICRLKEAARRSVKRIDDLLAKLDKVWEQDGTSNRND